jgi:hypothetical protein
MVRGDAEGLVNRELRSRILLAERNATLAGVDLISTPSIAQSLSKSENRRLRRSSIRIKPPIRGATSYGGLSASGHFASWMTWWQ